ncbi:MAG TPA: tyrosine-type recombinase/integrase [Candidatus Angelobacter sp.]|nr:tyrosine-type recombinase/integrase [Candidatus Angelobacter sp.]
MGKSYQKGYVALRGQKWYGYFRKTVLDPATEDERHVRVAVILGQKSQMTRSEAREALEREITKKLGQAGNGAKVMNHGSVTFDWFVRNRYLPLKEANWKEETAKVKRHIIQKHLIDPFAQVRMENFDRFTLQLHLKGLAKTNCRDTVLQVRAYLRDIFAEAVEQDFLVKDPARKVAVPAQLRESDKTTLTWEQLRRALGRLEFRDRLLMTLEMTNALRPGELFALRWSCFNHAESTMRLKETVYKGSLRPWGKTRKSLCVIPLPEELVPELLLWKQECSDSSPEAFIFPNEDGGFVDPGNYLKRVLKKLAKEIALPKLTFQVIRRTIATLGQTKGTVKSVQGMLRHNRTATTTDVYMQEMPEGVRATVRAICAELMALPNHGSGQRV